MAILMYDLVAADDRRPSPFCWRARFAMAHKGLAFETRPLRFTEIPAAAGGRWKTVPTIEDNGRTVTDSWAIAEYLERTYADRPSLFDGEGGKTLSLFVQNWVGTALHTAIFGMIVVDLKESMPASEREYFRESRERRIGRRLEAIQAGREERLPAFRQSLEPLRQTVAGQPFIGGSRPVYADYMVAGAFQWARIASPFRLLEESDPVHTWLGRCLDLHGGLGRGVPTHY